MKKWKVLIEFEPEYKDIIIKLAKKQHRSIRQYIAYLVIKDIENNNMIEDEFNNAINKLKNDNE